MAEMEKVEVESEGSKLAARELPSAINSSQLIEEHLKITNGKVRTRFPPEPNGYLHIGHAKSMNMNFELAFEKLGVPPEKRQTFFRYDDTNPEAESNEYIQSLREDVDWMGWKPDPVTFTSDYFPLLHQLAIELIKRGKAYVCHQSKAEIEACREIAKAKAVDPNAPGDPCSPYRNRSVEENLREFENMRKGKYGGSEATLRMKMDMTSPNPNMWDQVAYRIKYVPHPHAGSEWCIYPTYDYTHCIIDSTEHIDYSICTLEFETRRESYYWVLEALDLYRPKVYEMSRLNVSYTLLSKRKLLKLVMGGFMRGWDDPRMPTIKGLRRRGYTASILNAFCRDIGATRNANIVQYERLAAHARAQLHETSPRVMAVLKPIKVVITGRTGLGSHAAALTVPDYPFDPARGSHTVPMDDIVYIDAQDFRLEDDEDYFGLAPGKIVGLKYAFRIRCDSYELNSAGEPVVLKVTALADSDNPEDKPKGAIQWIPAHAAVPVEVRMYSHLFTVEEPSDANWEAELNPESEVVFPNALVDPSMFRWKPVPETHFQFERLGFFVVDKDSKYAAGAAAAAADATGAAAAAAAAAVDSATNAVAGVAGAVSAEAVAVVEELYTLSTTASTETVAAAAAVTSAAVAAAKKGVKLVLNLTVNLKDSKPKAAGAPAGKSRKEEQAKQLAEKMAKMSLSPLEMFKSQTDLYSQFDDEGIPTHDAAGEKISKSAYKKLRKDWEKQKKLYETSNPAATAGAAAGATASTTSS